MNNLEAVLITPQASLHDAMITLDRGGLQIAVVVDEDRKVMGTVTDGDIRRALLRKISLSTQVIEIMGKNPETATANESKVEVLARMKRRRLLQIPIVDKNNRIVSIQTLHDVNYPLRRNNSVFLMAGGFGKRLYPLTQDCPKPMLKVGGKPILELIIQSFVNAGFHRFYISTHYLPEVIRNYFGDGSRWNVNIQYIHEETPLGTGGALGLLPHDEIDSPMILMNGDLLTRVDYRSLLEFHERHEGAATLCVREYEHQIPYGVIQSDGLRITEIVEKPLQRCFISAGIYVLSPELVRRVAAGEQIDMPALLEREIGAGRDVNMFPVHEYWLDIGRMDDFNRAQAEVCGGYE